MRRSRTGTRIITAIALLLTFWLIWSRLNIVIWINIPWWGLLIVAVVIFLMIDYVLSMLFKRGS
ncbi:MAG: hypothetical protein MUD01_06975 [Chloroflexaceae bacterium]|jgi:hypothetical protein|nr:hypothetical protein [Chloroflexaceae bacterium]